jgi:ubiquinone biosynthesis protein UbiJ
MTELPSPTQIEAAERIAVDLRFQQAPLAIARLCEVVADLERRIAELEGRKKSSWSLR